MKGWSVLFFAATVCAQSWEKLPDGSSGQTLQVQTTDGVSVPGSVRKPDGPGPFPPVALIHGGGPSQETTYAIGRGMQEPAANLVAAGWAIFSLDFRPNPRGMLDPSD